MSFIILILGLLTVGQTADADVGLFTKSLWFVQQYGIPDQSVAESDQRLKSSLALGVAGDKKLNWEELNGWLERDTFQRIAGEDGWITEQELDAAMAAMEFDSRVKLHRALREHGDLLSTTYDMVHPSHYGAMSRLTDWIVANSGEGKVVQIITTCTGNSRRSILNAMMGNFAAAYYGLDQVRFYSGGTKPSAFNHRTIAALKGIGFEIEPTGEEAKRGEPTLLNRVYRVGWGQGMEALEFSKTYDDSSNPQTGFAAVLVCTEADAECPTVAGASLRVSMSFLDPKHYDDGPWESIKYAERRDDIGRTWMAVMADASRRIRALRNTESR